MIRTSPSYLSNMAQRNMLFNSQMLDLEIDQYGSFLQSESIDLQSVSSPTSISSVFSPDSMGREVFTPDSVLPASVPLREEEAGQSNLHRERHIFLRDTNGPAYPGRSVSGGNLEIGSISEQEYRNTTSSNNSTILLHPSSIHYHNYHCPPLVQGVQGLNHHFHNQIPALFSRRPMNDNLHHRNARNREDGRESMSSNTQHFYRPQTRLSRYAHVEITGHIRILPSEEVAVLEFPSMQPHTNDASYEELLALVERIGNVNTGLSEHTIINCLRTRTHTSYTASSAHDKSSEIIQNSICVVCQAEYEENDKIGILGCGHDYHVDCIKRWLLLKNVCPMCKRPAFSVDNNKC
ncbi:zinc finger protein [Cinnamomum micranthum f. kanehirae]|uniref:RING-type E3 ubiquitin transferase n=1 Tax=Cinnamomum micranthum f. kanehirae TaxID=337451 RepID=A0A443Q1K3_9MAGN|nr:zinc finger protein [Cinnamomum micranthum f. kanehirae]